MNTDHLVIFRCCRDWPCNPLSGIGRCGYCGEVPEWTNKRTRRSPSTWQNVKAVNPLAHDAVCELGNTNRAFNRPPVGSCWCEDRAQGFEHWYYSNGAATCEVSKVPDDETPPNMLGGAA